MSSAINKITPFLLGIVLGFCLTSIFKIGSFEDLSRNFYQCQNISPVVIINETVTIGIRSSPTPTPIPHYENITTDTEIKINNSVASTLEKQVRIVCWIMTRPANVTEKLESVRTTWGKRCTKLLFFSSANNTETGTIGLPNTEEGRDWLWAKTKEAFKYIYNHHLNDGEWFLKADDDTYVIMENLRYVLYGRDPMKATYFGCRFKDTNDNKSQGYMSGGAGYVLSKESLIRFAEISVSNPDLCFQDHTGPEDLWMGKCLEKVGVMAMDTRDSVQHHRFLPFTPDTHVNLKKGDIAWYWVMTYYPQSVGLECCSDFAVSFHYVSHKGMYELEYFTYHLKPFGISVLYNLPRRKIEDEGPKLII